MAKYSGMIGFRETVESETEPGIWEPHIKDHHLYGDVLKNYVHNSFDAEFTTTNRTPQCNNTLSLVADPYAYENFHNIVYAEFMGTKWTVSNVEVQYPRLLLSLGGVYSGENSSDASSGFN